MSTICLVITKPKHLDTKCVFKCIIIMYKNCLEYFINQMGKYCGSFLTRFVNFGQEAQLWNEVHGMSDSLQSENNDEKTQFSRGIYLLVHVILSLLA